MELKTLGLITAWVWLFSTFVFTPALLAALASGKSSRTQRKLILLSGVVSAVSFLALITIVLVSKWPT